MPLLSVLPLYFTFTLCVIFFPVYVFVEIPEIADFVMSYFAVVIFLLSDHAP